MNSKKLILFTRIALRLGVGNIVRVVVYRALCKLGMGPVSVVPNRVRSGVFFRNDHLSTSNLQPVEFKGLCWFGWYNVNSMDQNPPDWFYNPFTGNHYTNADKPWFELPDFSSDFGDIKCVWEQSRFQWALMWAQHARTTGFASYIDTLNQWIADWLVHNPGYFGPNWKCGQEASIRVMHLYFTSRLLGQQRDMPSPLQDLIGLHLKRIAPTLMYALSQDNNHGTSEAAALFIGGYWLTHSGAGWSQASNWAKSGRHWLEERVTRLILEDGTFSQYSVNYHRLVLDTLCMVELFRRDFNLPAFSAEFYRRASLATTWLYSLVQPQGGVSNLGANDGAQLLPLSNADYRDFRPSVQLASILFLHRCAYNAGVWNLPVQWLDIDIPKEKLETPGSKDFNEGGFLVIKNASAALYLRYPRFKFRPSQADVLHLDLWIGDTNVLRDAGTYSYNCPPPWLDYFSSIAAHSTVQNGGREPMPKISRFLYGEWAETEIINPLQHFDGKQIWCGRVKHFHGAVHARFIELSENGLRVIDEISQCDPVAILRWRLAPSNWRLNQSIIESDFLKIEIDADSVVDSIRLIEGWESLYYHQMKPVPVVEAVISKPGKIISYFTWHKTQ